MASSSLYHLFLNIKCVTKVNLDILTKILKKCSCGFLFLENILRKGVEDGAFKNILKSN